VVKLLYLVVDGVADRLSDEVTTLDLASKPGLDYIAEKGVCGVMYTVGKGIAPESDVAVISLLGYDPFKYYTGRGPLEALGAGVPFKEGYEVAFRANFATVDPGTLRIIDRRVGRSLRGEEARVLAEALDGMTLSNGGYVRVKATVGHRAVVVIGCETRRLSPMVENNDPAYGREGYVSVALREYEPFIKEVKPLDNSPEAGLTAVLVNEFTRKAIEVLDKHPVNRERRRRGEPPANAILLRDAGSELPKVEPLPRRYGLKFALVAEMPVELGIGRAFGADVMEVPLISGDVEGGYGVRLKLVKELLKTHDVIYVHLKGPDEPGHDGNMELKRRRVEEIDKYFITPLISSLGSVEAVLVTSDHATPPSVKVHTDDPVPIALMYHGIEPDDVRRFSEKECVKGRLGVIEHGWELLPKVLKMLKH